MASKAVAKAVAGGVVPISQKQTLQSSGFWERLRRFFVIDPNRSNGVPLNPWFRNPSPGSNDPLTYTDPVTTPAGDIADNPYWRRDTRRAYPQLSVVRQADLVQLLTVGSAAQPRMELVGEAGEKALVEAGKETSLEKCLENTDPAVVAEHMFVDGKPPLPSGQRLEGGKWGVHKYELAENSYPEKYPCKSFR